KNNTIPYAESARNDGIYIYTVGITDRINVEEVRKMASMPQKKTENYYLSKDFNSLTSVADALVSHACINGKAKDTCNAAVDLVFVID
ncbi:VWA domain-containing protein, partial [Bacillus thuringiensis]|nr:VWA domain-containing protein [Bacillus thuringiensis]